MTLFHTAYNEIDAAALTGGNADLCALNPVNPYTGEVRIVNSDLIGPVEVYYDQEWLPVCAFSAFEADVVCKQLRIPSAFYAFMDE